MANRFSTAPLSPETLNASRVVRDQVDSWRHADELFETIRRRFPEFDYPSCLLKCLLVNSLYSTNVFAIRGMVTHICKVLSSSRRPSGRSLVCRIAKSPNAKREFTSFASKFCHLFVDDSLPIYDSIAREVLKGQLGSAHRKATSSDSPYIVFCDNFDKLRGKAEIGVSVWEIDQFLWISGSYARWKNRKNVNANLREVFENPSVKAAKALALLIRRRPD